MNIAVGRGIDTFPASRHERIGWVLTAYHFSPVEPLCMAVAVPIAVAPAWSIGARLARAAGVA